MRALLAALLVGLLAAGCSAPSVPTVNAPDVKVDTAELRALKATTEIADCERQTAPVAEDGLPDVELPCLGGGPDVALARLRGPLVVNLWAQSCEPCRRELPIYETFHQKYAGKVGVLGVDWLDNQPGYALQMAKDSGVSYPQVADIEPHIQTMALPRLVLLDANGNVAFSDYLEIKSLPQLEELVEKHLGVKAS